MKARKFSQVLLSLFVLVLLEPAYAAEAPVASMQGIRCRCATSEAEVLEMSFWSVRTRHELNGHRVLERQVGSLGRGFACRVLIEADASGQVSIRYTENSGATHHASLIDANIRGRSVDFGVLSVNATSDRDREALPIQDGNEILPIWIRPARPTGDGARSCTYEIGRSGFLSSNQFYEDHPSASVPVADRQTSEPVHNSTARAASGAVRSGACDQPTIRAVQTVNGRVFQQFGQGIAFRHQGPGAAEYVFDPQHVTDHADKVFLRCGASEVEVRQLGSSATLDVGVLEIPEPARNQFNANVALDGWNVRRAGVSEPIPGVKLRCSRIGEEAQVTSQPSGAAMLVPAPINLPVTGTNYAVALLGGGVRPGMSGCTVLDDKDQVVGMVTRTAVGASLSFAVPISFMLDAAKRGLLAGRDSYGPSSGREGYLRTRQEAAADGSRLDRTYDIQLRTPEGRNVLLRGVCPSRAYAQTSNWELTGGGDYTRPGGGDYTRPGGDEPRSVTDLYQARISLSPEHQRILGTPEARASVYVPSYESKVHCDHPGVLMEDGRRLVGLRNMAPFPSLPEATISVDGVESIDYFVRHFGSGALAEIEKHGIFVRDGVLPADGYAPLCGGPDFGGARQLRGAAPAERCNLYPTPRGPEFIYGFAATMMPVLATQAAAGRASTLSCDSRTGQIRLLQPEVVTAGKSSLFDADLTLTSNRIQGRVRIGSCTINVRPDNQVKDFWTGRIESKGLSLAVSVDLQSPGIVVSIDPLRVPESCVRAYYPGGASLRLTKMTWSIGTPAQPNSGMQVLERY